jgi:phosphoglycerate kinase
LGDVLKDCRTLVWNGPMSAFETPPFDAATVAALNQAGVADDFTFVSTAGGAFLEWMEGKELPGVAALSR